MFKIFYGKTGGHIICLIPSHKERAVKKSFLLLSLSLLTVPFLSAMDGDGESGGAGELTLAQVNVVLREVKKQIRQLREELVAARQNSLLTPAAIGGIVGTQMRGYVIEEQLRGYALTTTERGAVLREGDLDAALRRVLGLPAADATGAAGGDATLDLAAALRERLKEKEVEVRRKTSVKKK